MGEVSKMKDVYGAHISNEQVLKITAYVVSINGKPDSLKLLKAEIMANRIGMSTVTVTAAVRLLVSVLLLGTLLAWWGTADHRHLFGESHAIRCREGVVLPEVTQEKTALVEAVPNFQRNARAVTK